MGNTCCANENSDDLNTFNFTKVERKKLLNNMNMMHENANISEHAPKSSIATVTDHMNEMTPVAKEVYNKEVKASVTRKEYQSKFEKYPYLGPYKFQDGSTYEGQFNLGLRHGFGRQIWKDGSIYEGYWEDDKCKGKGRLINQEGHIYFGDWKDDKAEGKGIFKHIDGTCYDGDWKNDVQCGFGKETWNDGSIYEGEYLDSLKHGQGSFKWSDGSQYNGDFVKNDISGHGKQFLYYPFSALISIKERITGLMEELMLVNG